MERDSSSLLSMGSFLPILHLNKKQLFIHYRRISNLRVELDGHYGSAISLSYIYSCVEMYI